MTSHLTLTYVASWFVTLALFASLPATDSAPRLARSMHAAGLLLVANKADRTLSVIEPRTGGQIAVVPEGGVTGHEVIASPDGTRAFVPIYGDSGVGKPGTDGSTIDVIDLETDAVIHTFDFGHGVRPHCILVGPADGLLYVTTELDQAITVIDPATLRSWARCRRDNRNRTCSRSVTTASAAIRRTWGQGPFPCSIWWRGKPSP